jgi:hypothetical protein
MTAISTWFLRAGAMTGAGGMALGIAMAASGDHSQMPLHAHLNLLGFVSLLLYGLFYRSVPAAAHGKLPRLHFGLCVAGLIAMVAGLSQIDAGRIDAGRPFAISGALLTIAAMVVFVVVVFRGTRPHAA